MENLIVYKGKGSQTGIAVQKEFGNEFDYKNSITLSGEKTFLVNLSFEDIREILQDESFIAVLPIWNSHEGEIDISFALRMLFENDVKLFHLWPKDIYFQCIINDGVRTKDVVSVTVAEQQCSDFIQKKGLKFEGSKSTMDAYNNFKSNSTKYYAALIPPEMNVDGFEILENSAQNPLNFTTFAFLSKGSEDSAFHEELASLGSQALPHSVYFYGLQMPLGNDFTEAQNILFDKFIEEAESIDSIPKAIFVADHSDGAECRIIFEINDPNISLYEVLDLEGKDESIRVIDDAGRASHSYSKRVMEHLKEKSDVVSSKDFVKHEGTKSCFFACPPLGILTHGFSIETTESIVKRMVATCFDLLIKQDFAKGQGTPESDFFDKYKSRFLHEGTEFVRFESI